MRPYRSILPLWIALLVAAPAAQSRDLGDMSSTEITALQQRLADGGCYQGAIDGQSSPALEAAIKACPSQDPILRIETGMHVAQIWRIGVDRACRIAATGSEDKTVRVWSLPDGRLLRTLRVPIALDKGGKIYATAVSPDGRWIAAAGWDAQGGHKHFVYIFDAATGALVARVGAFNGITHYLTFSADARWLAATSQVGVGLNVIDTRTWQIVATDKTFTDESYGAAFAPDGRLYVIAYDHKLRQYQYKEGPAFKKEREIETLGRERPYSIAVDPRGKLLAVGFDQSTRVDIYDAATLEFRFAADVKGIYNGIYNGDLSKVAWSSDGARLVASGSLQGQGKRLLVTFDRDGRQIGDPLPLPAYNTISALQPCQDTIAVAAHDPAFGLVDGSGHITLWKTGVAPDMRDKLAAAFTIAPNAGQVRFGLAFGADDAVVFDLVQATVTSAPDPSPLLLAPLVEGLSVTYWKNNFHPAFAYHSIQLQQDEMSRSLAIRPDRTGFVLGTDYWLRAFDAQGRQIWVQPGHGVASGVNISTDGHIVVVAYGDGTIRWHRWSDGGELLALFVDRKSRAWVAWTPTGYYMASPSGEDLIGWQLNRGWNQAADFFPASRFRARFNRPDIVRLVLDTLDEEAAIKRANEIAGRKEVTRPLIEHLPPIVRISSPADGTRTANGTVTLRYAARSPSGQPIERIDVLINGRPVKGIGLLIRTVPPDTEITGSIDVKLTQRVAELGLIAWTGGLASEAARIKVTWDGAPEATRRLFALVVGVSDYSDPAMKLTYAAKDARDFDNALKGQKGAYYVDVETRVLTDREVTRSSIMDGLAWLKTMATNANDVSVVFLAGHGLTDEKQTYWFFPSDATGSDDVRAKGVSQDEVRVSLTKLSGRVLWFLDTCHAGSAGKRPPVDINVLINTVTSAENGGIVVFASSTGRQLSAESSEWGNGAFTKAIVEGIQLGKADLLGDGFITTSSLDTFVEHRVRVLTEDRQNPVMGRPPDEPDFAIAQVSRK